MADSISLRIPDIAGLTPAVDARKQQGYQLLSGDNVYFDSKGLKSGFGDDYLIDRAFSSGAYVQSIRVRIKTGDRTFVFHENTVQEYDESTGTFNVIFVVEGATMSAYRWTAAYLNGYLFFCHPATGIIYYSVNGAYAGLHNDIADVAFTAPLAIAVNNGRLCVLTVDALSWSDQSDGFTFSPELGGPGFQLVNDRVSGKPIMIASYDKGVMTLTSGGIMKSEFTGDQATFRHRAIHTEYAPINSFCVFKTVEEQIVFLDKRGFFASSGDTPKAYTPLWNEFLISELQKFRLLEKENTRVEWDENNRLLFLSFSESDVEPLYDYAYVLYPPLDKWSLFSQQHYGIMPIDITVSERRKQYMGYMGADKKIRYWNLYPNRVVTSADATQYGYNPLVQYPLTRDVDSSYVVSASACRVSALDESNMAGIAGYYIEDGSTLQPKEVTGLGAKARIGLLQFTQNQYPDELSEVSDITIGSVISNDGNVPIEDFNLIPDGVSNEDYNTATGTADYGFGTISYVDFNFDIISTMDGRSAYDTQTPVLARFFANQRYFVTMIVGIHHILEFRADSAGQMFHLQDVELNGLIAGRLN